MKSATAGHRLTNAAGWLLAALWLSAPSWCRYWCPPRPDDRAGAPAPAFPCAAAGCAARVAADRPALCPRRGCPARLCPAHRGTHPHAALR